MPKSGCNRLAQTSQAQWCGDSPAMAALDRVHHGETVTITKNDLPIADLVKHRPRGKRRLGSLRGRIVVPDDFADEDPEIRDMFYPAGQ